MRLTLLTVVLATALVAAPAVTAHGGKSGLLRAAADYVQLTKPQLVQELHSGKSLTQVAEARGKTRAGLVSALVAAVKTKIDAKARLTAEQKAAALVRAQAEIERLVDRVGVRGGRKHARLKGGLLRVAADYLQLEHSALKERLRAGSSLAEVAVAQGKTRAGLKTALLDAVKARLDRSTRLTAEQKAAALTRADAKIERLLDLKRTKKS